MSNSVPLKGDADKKIGATLAPLSVSAQDTPNMTVKIRAGSFWNSAGVVVEFAGGNSPTIIPPVSGSSWSLISLNDVGSIVVTVGVSGAAPSIPTPPAGNLPLAAIYLLSTTTSITNAFVMDVRPLLRVEDLVPDLSAELADRPTFTDMNNALVLKADVDGTPNSVFFLNKDAVGPANALISVDRGASADVSIRWNETTDKWQFTNDGTTFVDIASVSGVFMTLVASPTSGHVLTTDSGGQAVDSGTALSALATSASVTAGLATKADKVVPSSANNVATLSVSGNLQDSGTLFTALTTDVELAAGLATKADVSGDTFTGSIIVDDGVNQPIALASFDSGSSGLVVDRSPSPNAVLEFDESTDQWMAGIVGSVFPILTAENLALSDLTDVSDVLAPSANDVLRFVGGMWTSSNLSDFATDTEVTTAVSTHAADLTLHLTSNQNGMLDGLEVAATGIFVKTAAASSTTRSVATANSARITVADGDGVAANPTIDLALLADSGTGTFLKLTRDTWGRVSGTTPVLTADITTLVDATYVNVAGDTMAGVLNMNQNDITNADAVTADRFVTIVQALTPGLSVGWDMSDGTHATLALSDNAAVTITNPTVMIAGTIAVLSLTQGAITPSTVTFDTAFKWVGGLAPTVTNSTNAVDLFTFWTDGINLWEISRSQNLS